MAVGGAAVIRQAAGAKPPLLHTCRVGKLVVGIGDETSEGS